MIGLHNRQTLLARIRPDQPYSSNLRATVSNVLDVGERLGALKERLAQDNRLSDVGRRARLAEEAKTTLAREFAKASEPVRKGLAHFKARRESLKPPEPNRNDAVGEMRRMEIRAYLASLPAEKRTTQAFELAKNQECETAILDAPAALSGMPAEHYERLRADRIERLFAAELREIEAMEGDYQNAGAALAIVRGQLREASGLAERFFEELMAPLEAEPAATKPAPQSPASPPQPDYIKARVDFDKRFDALMAGVVN